MSIVTHMAGRPRDTSIDARVLAATRSVLADRGFEAATIHAVAEECGIFPSSIYRRWPSRIELIEQAVAPDLAPVRPTGDIRLDMAALIDAFFDAWDQPAARAAMPGLMAAYQADGRSGDDEDWLALSARPQFLDIVRASDEAVDPEVDLHDVFDELLGAIIARILVPTVARRGRRVDRLVEMVVRLVQPTTRATHRESRHRTKAPASSAEERHIS